MANVRKLKQRRVLEHLVATEEFAYGTEGMVPVDRGEAAGIDAVVNCHLTKRTSTVASE